MSEPLLLFLPLLPDVDVVLGGRRKRGQEGVKDAEELVGVSGVGLLTEEPYHLFELKSDSNTSALGNRVHVTSAFTPTLWQGCANVLKHLENTI